MVAISMFTLPLADSWDWHHGDIGGGWMILMMIGMILFWVAVIGLVVYLVRDGFGSRRRDTALEILDRRFAAGEISKEEYEERRSTLAGG